MQRRRISAGHTISYDHLNYVPRLRGRSGAKRVREKVEEASTLVCQSPIELLFTRNSLIVL